MTRQLFNCIEKPTKNGESLLLVDRSLFAHRRKSKARLIDSITLVVQGFNSNENGNGDVNRKRKCVMSSTMETLQKLIKVCK